MTTSEHAAPPAHFDALARELQPRAAKKWKEFRASLGSHISPWNPRFTQLVDKDFRRQASTKTAAWLTQELRRRGIENLRGAVGPDGLTVGLVTLDMPQAAMTEN